MEYDLNISSYDIPFCATCKLPITEENDSKWEIFVGNVGDMIKTQPICVTCDSEMRKTPMIKSKE